MTAILLTCGIGDFIAIESHRTPAEREDVTAIHWATRARESLMPLVPFVFPNVVEHVIERDTWGAPFTPEFCISSRADLPDLDPAVVDWSVQIIADDVFHQKRHYRGSTLVKQTLADISRLNLPAKYFVVHPYSANVRTPERDLTGEEWRAAHRRGVMGAVVIVNRGEGETLESFPNVIDLTNELTLLEAIEVTKGAAGFIGCASVFAVVAAKVLPEDRLFIKANPIHRKMYHWFYYAPHDSNAFISVDLLRILPND